MHCCISILSCYIKLIRYLFKKQFSEIKRKEKIQNVANFRSSHQRCSIKKSILRNFTKFTGKHLCQSLFFDKVDCFWKQTGAGFWILLIFLNLKPVRTCFIVVASRMILLLEKVIRACLHLFKDMLK